MDVNVYIGYKEEAKTLPGMLIYLNFQTVGNFSCTTLQNKCLLAGPCLSNSYFNVGKIVIWPQVVNFKML